MTLDPQVNATLHWLEDPRRAFPEWTGPMIVHLVKAYAAQREALGVLRQSHALNWPDATALMRQNCREDIDAALSLGRQEVQQ